MNYSPFHLLWVMLLLVSGCSIFKGNSQVQQREKVVISFLEAMIEGGSDEQLLSYLSTQSFEDKNVQKEDFWVNTYSPSHFKIVSIQPPLVETIIYRPDNDWAHRLVFKVEKEKKNWVLVPQELHFDQEIGDFVDPWWSVETYVSFEE